MDNLYIVMPAYNEEANIESVVEEWYPHIADKGSESRLVIADSGSTDRTHSILLSLKKRYPRLEILSDTGKQHGPKLMALYQYAICMDKVEYVFQTDSDGQTNAAEFETFWKLRKQYEAVIGKRNQRGDGIFRLLVERVLCMILYFIFGVRVPDANAPFRLMKTSLIEKYLNKMPSDYNLPNVMLTTYFKYYSENIRFIQISFKPRQGGKNFINLVKIMKIGWKALRDFYCLKEKL